MSHEIVIGLHLYQPPREATHPILAHISTDPQDINWTGIIKEQCYDKLANENILSKISFDIYQSLILQLEKIDPNIVDIYRKSMDKNGIGESFIHPILPDLSKIDKQIIISAGLSRFKELSGSEPKIFWPPETAIDTETLEVLVDNGYTGFVCAPEQIIQASGSPSDNQPTVILLPSSRQIVAFPFDRQISSQLAFNPKNNADTFVREIIKPRLDENSKKVAIAWTDGETFGHHFVFAHLFLDYLLNTSLPSAGLYPISINSLKINISSLPIGKIKERSAWSCPHGDLIRWNGSCDCHRGQDTIWKQPYSFSLKTLNNQISQVLESTIGVQYAQLVSENFYRLYAQPETVKCPTDSLVAAKISALIARTSCATFFDSPEVSGKINLLYAYQSLLYLRESGLTKEADVIQTTLFENLSKVVYPTSHKTALESLEKILVS